MLIDFLTNSRLPINMTATDNFMEFYKSARDFTSFPIVSLSNTQLYPSVRITIITCTRNRTLSIIEPRCPSNLFYTCHFTDTNRRVSVLRGKPSIFPEVLPQSEQFPERDKNTRDEFSLAEYKA